MEKVYKNDTLENLIKIVYVCLLAIYLCGMIFQSSYMDVVWDLLFNVSLFSFMDFFVQNVLYVSLFVLIAIKIISKRPNLWFVFLGCALFIYFYLISTKFKDWNLIVSVLFIFAMPRTIDNVFICKIYLGAIGFAIIMVCILNRFGVIPESLSYRTGNVVRHSLGFTSPNALGNYVMLLVVVWVYSRFNEWCIRDGIVSFIVTIVTYVITNSRMSLLLSVGFIIFASIHSAFGKYKLFDFINVIIFNVAKWIFCAFGILSCLITILYSNNYNDMYRILNSLLSDRLYFMTTFYNEYGFKFLGQPIRVVTARMAMDSNLEWRNIDNTYVLLAIKYGISLLVGFMIMYWLLGREIKKKKDLGAAVLLIIFATSGLTESILISVATNFLLLLIAVVLNSNIRKKYIYRCLEVEI